MRMAPRPRNRLTRLPGGIKPDALPTGVYWDTTGLGRWVYRYRQGDKQRSARLGGSRLTLREIWEAYEAITRPQPARTISSLIRAFESSHEWADLSPLTQRNYRSLANTTCRHATRNGVPIGDTKLADWTPGAVKGYVDMRAQESRSRANAELRYLRRLFAWARERDWVDRNPASGVRGVSEPATKSRYVSDAEYEAFLLFVAERKPVIVIAAELAYLCRLRLSEVCDVRQESVLPDGLYAARKKGSKHALTEWTPRLKKAVETARKLHGPVSSLYLLPGSGGGRKLNVHTLSNYWQAAMNEWTGIGNRRFRFHDLKVKGVSDAEGDKLAAGGHRSMSMLRVYDVLPAKAPATR